MKKRIITVIVAAVALLTLTFAGAASADPGGAIDNLKPPALTIPSVSFAPNQYEPQAVDVTLTLQWTKAGWADYYNICGWAACVTIGKDTLSYTTTVVYLAPGSLLYYYVYACKAQLGCTQSNTVSITVPYIP